MFAYIRLRTWGVKTEKRRRKKKMKTRKQIKKVEAEKKNTHRTVIIWTVILIPAALFTYAAVYALSSIAGILAAAPK